MERITDNTYECPKCGGIHRYKNDDVTYEKFGLFNKLKPCIKCPRCGETIRTDTMPSWNGIRVVPEGKLKIPNI